MTIQKCDICEEELSNNYSPGLFIANGKEKIELTFCEKCTIEIVKKLDELKDNHPGGRL